jgi:two-component system chemotaxis sensor kinase CheA
VRDDGKACRAKADQEGPRARHRRARLDDRPEVWSLIFAPGFSTADVVTDVSGRGVGMDVVKKNITALGGTVEIDSAEGYGMSVKVRLPLTLAIMDGMSVGVGDEVYILPLSSVVESFQVEARRIKTIGGIGPRGRGARRVHAGHRLEDVFQVPRFDFEHAAASWSSSRPRAGASRCWWTNCSASSRWWSRTSKPTTARSTTCPAPRSWGRPGRADPRRGSLVRRSRH